MERGAGRGPGRVLGESRSGRRVEGSGRGSPTETRAPASGQGGLGASRHALHSAETVAPEPLSPPSLACEGHGEPPGSPTPPTLSGSRGEALRGPRLARATQLWPPSQGLWSSRNPEPRAGGQRGRPSQHVRPYEASGPHRWADPRVLAGRSRWPPGLLAAPRGWRPPCPQLPAASVCRALFTSPLVTALHCPLGNDPFPVGGAAGRAVLPCPWPTGVTAAAQHPRFLERECDEAPVGTAHAPRPGARPGVLQPLVPVGRPPVCPEGACRLPPWL